MEIGIQVSSFKPVLRTEDQVQYAFRRMAEMGCRTVQLQWIDPGVSPAFIAGCMAEHGFRSMGVQDFYETIRTAPEYYTELNRLTGGEWMCVSRIPDRLKYRSGLDDYVQELRQFQRALDPLGQRLCLHPVTADFSLIDGMDPVEYLLERMPELMVCADLYHLNRSVSDAPGWLRRYGTRICMAHFKEGKGDALTPLGQGDMDWTPLLQACRDISLPCALAEQETWQGDPFACLEESFRWLSASQGLEPMRAGMPPQALRSGMQWWALRE